MVLNQPKIVSWFSISQKLFHGSRSAEIDEYPDDQCPEDPLIDTQQRSQSPQKFQYKELPEELSMIRNIGDESGNMTGKQ
jgi:hypothetical protein